MILGISTGCCYELGLSRIESLRFLKRFDIDAVELMLARAEDVTGFKPTRGDIAFLRSKKYVSLHAPFVEVDYKNNKETKELLRALNSLALKVNAENVVFHANCIKDFSLFDSVNFVPLVENLNFRSDAERLVSAGQAKDFLAEHKNFGFCLDIGHALKQEIEPVDFLRLGNKLKQAHVHFLHLKGGKLEPHGLPSRAEKKLIENAQPVLSASIPLILEAHFFQGCEALIPKELELLRRAAKKPNV